MFLRHVLILNGPNLNMLGRREPETYGHATLSDIEASCATRASELDLDMAFRQSNHEGEIVDWIQDLDPGETPDRKTGIIINAGGFTHTSVAIRDALLAVARPVIEVHLSNIHARESFRRRSYISDVARGVICGLGQQGYLAAMDAMAVILADEATG